MVVSERGWYKTGDGRFVEVVYVSKFGTLTVAMHDTQDMLYAYFSDGTRSAYSDYADNIISRCRKPTTEQLTRQKDKP